MEFLAPIRVPAVRTLKERVVRILRKGIILGTFRPGSRLIEVELAERLQVSRSTIREAFRLLEAESLVEVSPHRGTRVASVNASDAIEICDLHALIESHIVRKLELPVSNQLRETLVKHVVAMENLSFPENVDEFIDIDRQFHFTLVSAAQHRRFEQVWNSMNSLLGLLVAVLVQNVYIDAKETAARHQAVIDAVSQPNRDIAAIVISDHYQTMGERTEEALRMQFSD